MSFLTLNGIPLSTTPDVTREEVVIGGGPARAFAGNMRTTDRARKFKWTFRTPPLSQVDANAYRGLIAGLGHSFTFDTDLYSAKGLPQSATVSTVTAAVASGKFSNKVTLVSGARLEYTPFTSMTNVTVMLWRLETAVWHHYVIRSGGAKWYDGVRNDAVTTSTFFLSSSFFQFRSDSGTESLDDIVLLPYKILDTWAPVFGVATAAFPSLPILTAAGDFSPQGSISVIGEILSTQLITGVLGGTLAQTNEVIEFCLYEV